MVKKRRGKCVISNRELRFIITVLTNIREPGIIELFLSEARKHFDMSEEDFALCLDKEIHDVIEFKKEDGMSVPGKFPRVFGEIQCFDLEAIEEREKIEKVAEIVVNGESADIIMSLKDLKVVYYCWFCKKMGYDKNNYLNHNFRGGHKNKIICPATYNVMGSKKYIDKIFQN